MRLSNYFMPTLRETPSEAHVVSHQLMLRSAMIYQVTSGIYAWSPLGMRVLNRLSDLARETQNAAGGAEVLMPTIQPASLWEESGRYQDYGKEMLRIQDRHGVPMLYGPTGEEVVTAFFRDQIKSYKDLPQRLYQIQWKFRDEIRPRFGVMRGREFLMKDLYSFDVSQEAALKSYDAILASYYEFFRRLEVTVLAIQADTGPIGGDLSHEFVMLASSGETTVTCEKGLAEQGAMTLEELRATYAMADDQHDPDSCPVPAEKLDTLKGIEVGHVFYFGTKYSASLGATVMMPDGSKQPVHMGSYGIGLSRLVAALIEASHDDRGIIWPEAAAPFDIGLICLKPNDAKTASFSDALYEKIQKTGFSVLYDDKSRSAGEKFADMDLIGLPYQVIVGPKGLESNTLEIKHRQTGTQTTCSEENFLQALLDKNLKKIF